MSRSTIAGLLCLVFWPALNWAAAVYLVSPSFISLNDSSIETIRGNGLNGCCRYYPYDACANYPYGYRGCLDYPCLFDPMQHSYHCPVGYLTTDVSRFGGWTYYGWVSGWAYEVSKGPLPCWEEVYCTGCKSICGMQPRCQQQAAGIAYGGWRNQSYCPGDRCYPGF
jgi:hypothetical protein